ncbi:Photosystem II CP47 reaction center protein, partial [Melia azedarach]
TVSLEPEQTAGDKPEEGEDDVKSSCPLCPGRHTCYNGRDKGSRSREGELTPQNPSSFRIAKLQLACMQAGNPLVIWPLQSHTACDSFPWPCTQNRPVTHRELAMPKSLPIKPARRGRCRKVRASDWK